MFDEAWTAHAAWARGRVARYAGGMDSPAFDLRPPARYPEALVAGMRRSLDAGAGRIGRAWVEEMTYADDAPPSLLLAAELRGEGATWAHDEVAQDLRRRLAEDVEGVDGDRVRVAVLHPGEAGGPANPLWAYFQEVEPFFGDPRRRAMNLDELRPLLSAPRRLPAPQPANKFQSGAGETAGAAVFIAVVGAGLAWLAVWLLPGRWGTAAAAVVAAVTLAVEWANWTAGLPAAVRGRGELRALPMTLAAVVQAFEALWVRSHPDYPDGARFGLVAVFTLDPRHRDDPAWLGWMARRLAWLRDHEAGTPDETRVARRLEGEHDDGTSRIPASVSGNDATYWVSPKYERRHLPGDKLPSDGLLPILLEPGAAAGADRVAVRRPWPAELWPLRYRPPWEDQPNDVHAPGRD